MKDRIEKGLESLFLSLNVSEIILEITFANRSKWAQFIATPTFLSLFLEPLQIVSGNGCVPAQPSDNVKLPQRNITHVG